MYSPTRIVDDSTDVRLAVVSRRLAADRDFSRGDDAGGGGGGEMDNWNGPSESESGRATAPTDRVHGGTSTEYGRSITRPAPMTMITKLLIKLIRPGNQPPLSLKHLTQQGKKTRCAHEDLA